MGSNIDKLRRFMGVDENNQPLKKIDYSQIRPPQYTPSSTVSSKDDVFTSTENSIKITEEQSIYLNELADVYYSIDTFSTRTTYDIDIKRLETILKHGIYREHDKKYLNSLAEFYIDEVVPYLNDCNGD